MKVFFISLLLLCAGLEGYSQEVVAQRKAASKKVIPEVVMNTFNEMYPDVLVKGWYVTHLTYWQNDYSSGWYSDWYGPRTVVIYRYEKPSHFEVEFIDAPGELSRSIYNLYGYWHETRTTLKGLPPTLMSALKQSKFSGWKVSPLIERIESPAWSGEIYRFQVSKGLSSRIIRMDSKGNIIQSKHIND